MRENDRVKKAVALTYTKGQEGAPKLVASGSGPLADKIIQLAEENNVPVHRDLSLLKALSKLAPGIEIPTELYVVVAELLVFIYNLDQKHSNKKNSPGK